MLKSLKIENFRGFNHFELHDLGRVNLIVGTNNAGKTSVLEAIDILESPSDFGPIGASLSRRGEVYFEEIDGDRNVRVVDTRRLFHGHEAVNDSRISFTAKTDRGEDRFEAFVAELNLSERQSNQLQLPLDETFESENNSALISKMPALGLRWRNGQTKGDVTTFFRMTRRGGVRQTETRQVGPVSEELRTPVRLITASSLSPNVVSNLFDQVVLTPDEDFVIDALRIIEPTIDRIATTGADGGRTTYSRNLGGRGGLLVKCRDIADRVPIGSMGDGIWRLLGLALALVRTEGGILLVDEIDTGLHYEVMESMWKLVSETARRHNTQIFATTHSRDCYESLAVICSDSVSKNSEITIQRVERGKKRTIAYSEQEIVAAAARGMEVR